MKNLPVFRNFWLSFALIFVGVVMLQISILGYVSNTLFYIATVLINAIGIFVLYASLKDERSVLINANLPLSRLSLLKAIILMFIGGLYLPLGLLAGTSNYEILSMSLYLLNFVLTITSFYFIFLYFGKRVQIKY